MSTAFSQQQQLSDSGSSRSSKRSNASSQFVHERQSNRRPSSCPQNHIQSSLQNPTVTLQISQLPQETNERKHTDGSPKSPSLLTTFDCYGQNKMNQPTKCYSTSTSGELSASTSQVHLHGENKDERTEVCSLRNPSNGALTPVEQKKPETFLKGKTIEEVDLLMRQFKALAAKSLQSEREARKKQCELANEAFRWRSKCDELENQLKNLENAQQNVATQPRKSEHLARETIVTIQIPSSRTIDEKPVTDCLMKPLSKINSPPMVSGLPPTSRLPGEPPGAPPRKTKPMKSAVAVLGIPNVGEMLTKRFHQEKINTTTPPQRPQHNRLQFYWSSPAQGSPRSICKEFLPKIEALVSSGPLDEQIPLNTDTETIKESGEEESKQRRISFHEALSVYSSYPEEDEINVLLKDKRLQECFTKKKVETVKKTASTSRIESTESTKRASVLGPAASQKYHITVRCFSKAFDGWDGFKAAILQCQLNMSQINLLLETIPDPETSKGSRKLQEWEGLVTKVDQFHKSHPNEELYEDEAFVHYISTIPNLHQRLQCMSIMISFGDVLQKFNSDISSVMDAIEMLLKNTRMPKLFKAILSVCNYLNEGTSMANRKWFRLGSLKKVSEFKGVGRDAKSLLYFLAYHLGPILSPDEINTLQKAAQVSVVQVVQNTLSIVDIFTLLSEQQSTSQKDKPLLYKKRRASILPGQDDANDRFAEVGREFIQLNKSRFIELREDVKRLLQDYYLCVQYFGDVESFIPIDKKIDDERNPGQQRYIPDLISILNEFFSSYRLAIKEIENEKEKEKLEATRKERKLGQSTRIMNDGEITTKSRSDKPTISATLLRSSSTIMPPASVVTGAPTTITQSDVSTLPSYKTSEVTKESIKSSTSVDKPVATERSNDKAPSLVDQTITDTKQLPNRRASLRPSLFHSSGCPITYTGGHHKIDAAVLKDVNALNELNEDAPMHCGSDLPSDGGIVVNQNQKNGVSSPTSAEVTVDVTKNNKGTEFTKVRRRESLRAITGLLTSISKEKDDHLNRGELRFGRSFEDDSPPFPGACPLPGLTGVHNIMASQNRLSSKRFGAPVINRSTKLSNLASLPESLHESETPPSSPFEKFVPPRSDYFPSPARPSPFRQNLQNGHSGASLISTPQTSQLGFSRPTSASSARNHNKENYQDALKRIRSMNSTSKKI